jgi:hypothetical protein
MSLPRIHPSSPLALKGASAEVGVVEIDLTDGSAWTYGLRAKGQFEIGGSPRP